MSSSGTTQEIVEDPTILDRFAVVTTRIVNGEGKASLKFTGMTKDMERCKYKIRIVSRDGSSVMMALRGLPDDLRGRFIGRTDDQPVPYDWPDRGGRERGLQIQRWLDACPGSPAFAIVDDDADMAHLLPHLVQTDTMVGMTDADADRLIAMLAEGDR